jgi:hypothetical protein
VFGIFHFGKSKVEGQRGLRALVLTHPILMKAITAASSAEVIERQTKVVAAQEPLKGTFGLN